MGQKQLFLEKLRLVTYARGLPARRDDGFSHSVNITVTFVYEWQGELGYVTGLWSNVKRGSADCYDVVDLAGVNDTDKRIAHHDDVQVRGRQRTRKLM